MRRVLLPAPPSRVHIIGRRTELLFENIVVGQVFSLVTASILTWLRQDEQPTAMAAWFLMILVTLVLRLSIALGFHRYRAALRDEIWLRMTGTAAVLSGTVWGLGSVIMVREGSAWAVTLSAFALAGMAAGAVPLLSAQIEIYWLYSTVMLAPNIVTLLTLPPTRWTISMAVMTALFWISLLVSSRRFAQALNSQVQREAELAVARDLAEEASRAKSAFLANMSHEIRTPMNGLLGIAEVLKLSGLDEQQTELVDILNQSGRSMMQVLNQILDFTELEAGRHAVDQIRCAPAELIKTVIEMFEAAAHLKGLTLHCDLSPDLPHHVISAPREIVNIVTLLLGNAIKFTDQGAVDLSVWCGQEAGQAADEIMLYVSVTDSGRGIPAAEQERIFAAFTQVDDSITRDFGGVGLGLAITKRTVLLLGGDITVESTPGRGSRFFVYLPVRMPA